MAGSWRAPLQFSDGSASSCNWGAVDHCVVVLSVVPTKFRVANCCCVLCVYVAQVAHVGDLHMGRTSKDIAGGFVGHRMGVASYA